MATVTGLTRRRRARRARGTRTRTKGKRWRGLSVCGERIDFDSQVKKKSDVNAVPAALPCPPAPAPFPAPFRAFY